MASSTKQSSESKLLVNKDEVLNVKNKEIKNLKRRITLLNTKINKEVYKISELKVSLKLAKEVNEECLFELDQVKTMKEQSDRGNIELEKRVQEHHDKIIELDELCRKYQEKLSFKDLIITDGVKALKAFEYTQAALKYANGCISKRDEEIVKKEKEISNLLISKLFYKKLLIVFLILSLLATAIAIDCINTHNPF